VCHELTGGDGSVLTDRAPRSNRRVELAPALVTF
jgi:hypothetical protein